MRVNEFGFSLNLAIGKVMNGYESFRVKGTLEFFKQCVVMVKQVYYVPPSSWNIRK